MPRARRLETVRWALQPAPIRTPQQRHRGRLNATARAPDSPVRSGCQDRRVPPKQGGARPLPATWCRNVDHRGFRVPGGCSALVPPDHATLRQWWKDRPAAMTTNNVPGDLTSLCRRFGKPDHEPHIGVPLMDHQRLRRARPTDEVSRYRFFPRPTWLATNQWHRCPAPRAQPIQLDGARPGNRVRDLLVPKNRAPWPSLPLPHRETAAMTLRFPRDALKA